MGSHLLYLNHEVRHLMRLILAVIQLFVVCNLEISQAPARDDLPVVLI